MTTLLIPEMTCGHCKATVEKTIKSLDPAATLDFDMTARSVTLSSTAALPALQAALSQAGYETTTP